MGVCVPVTEISFDSLDTKITADLKNLVFMETLKKYKRINITFDEFVELYDELLRNKIESLIEEYFRFIPGEIEIRLGVAELYQKFVK